MSDSFSTVYYGIAGLILNAGVIGVLAKLLWNSQEKKIDTIKQDLEKNVDTRVRKETCDKTQEAIKENFDHIREDFQSVFKRFDAGTKAMGRLDKSIALIGQKLGVAEEED